MFNTLYCKRSKEPSINIDNSRSNVGNGRKLKIAEPFRTSKRTCLINRTTIRPHRKLEVSGTERCEEIANHAATQNLTIACKNRNESIQSNYIRR